MVVETYSTFDRGLVFGGNFGGLLLHFFLTRPVNMIIFIDFVSYKGTKGSKDSSIRRLHMDSSKVSSMLTFVKFVSVNTVFFRKI